ncbi:MAG: lipoprotein [Bacteroidetes bacterium]|nr:lipoprotein [Bacteroidota bacterium]
MKKFLFTTTCTLVLSG